MRLVKSLTLVLENYLTTVILKIKTKRAKQLQT